MKKISDWMLVDIQGRMDAFNYDLVTHQLETLIQMGKKRLAIDLNDVDFLSIQSLRFFSSVADKLLKKQGRLAFVSTPKALQEKIDVFNSSDHFLLVEDVDSLIKRGL